MSRIRHVSLSLYGAIVLLLGGLNFYVYTDLRDEAVADEIGDISRQAEIRAQDIETSLTAVQFALQRVALQQQLHGGNPRYMHEQLALTERALDYVRSIAVTDAAGALLHSSRSFPAPSLRVADLPSFAYFLGGGTDMFFFSGPQRNRLDGRWQMTISTAIRDAAGTLQGVVSSVLDPYAYSESFSTGVAAQDYVTVLDRDFRLLSRWPWLEDQVGQSLATAPAYAGFTASGAAQYSGIHQNLFTGESRIVSVRRLFGDRLVLSSSRPLEQAIANWRSLARIVSGISLLILVLGGIAVAFSSRILAERERRSQVLAQLNRELTQETMRAEKLASVKSEFLANMSHEIRTPMNGVLGMAQALQKLPLDDRAREYVGIIHESAGHLLALLNDILDFSRLEAGRMQLTLDSMQLPPLLDSVAALFAPACRLKGVEFRIELDADAPRRLESDPGRLRQVLNNLVGNAVKFTAQGSVVLRVVPRPMPDGRPGVRFEVIDTGAGIAPAALAHIFERFSQEDATTVRRFGGSGLGLGISKRLTELLGGTIGCASEKGAGSRFWIDLPQYAADPGLPAPAAAPPPAATPAAPLDILVVDDNTVNRRIINVLLRPFGHRLVEADSGARALELAAAQRFDVVLLDIHMPEMDGLEAHRRLRALDVQAPRRIVALTADVVPEALAAYDAAGFDAVVAKPVVLETLLDALRPPALAA